MTVRITIQPDYHDLDPIVRDVQDMEHVFSLALHVKPVCLANRMRAMRHNCYLDDLEFERALLWVGHGDSWSIKEDTTLLTFVLRRAIETLGITHEQEMEINPHLRAMVEWDRAAAAEPYPLPEAAE